MTERKNRKQIEKWCLSIVTGDILEQRKTIANCGYEKVIKALYV